MNLNTKKYNPFYYSTTAHNKATCVAIEENSLNFLKGKLGGITGNVSNSEHESGQYFYHSDHLGSSSFITDATGTAIQHLQYLPYGETFINQQTTSYQTRYTFSGKEKDTETDYGYFGARYLMSDLSIWISVDPMADKYPHLSAYNYCVWNPVMFVDPNGEDIDPTTSGYAEATKAATPEYDKNGKQINPSYQPAFEKLYNEWKENDQINVKFHSNGENLEENVGGTVTYNGVNNDGKKDYSVIWDPSITEQLGASAMFEESAHLKDVLDGKFTLTEKGSPDITIKNEADAKIWVAKNIQGIKKDYTDKDGYIKRTHYNQIKRSMNNYNKLIDQLQNGVTTIGVSLQKDDLRGKPFNVYGFGGENYKKLKR